MYVCSSCGGYSVEVNAARPSIDDRYPIGHCVRCTPWPKQVENPMKPGTFTQPPRKNVPLVRADVFDRDEFDHRQRVAEARRLAAKLTSSKAGKMSEAELKAARDAVEWLQRDVA